MKKIITFVLLIVGLGLGTLAVYGYFLSAEHARCRRLNTAAQVKIDELKAAQGTPKAIELWPKAREESDFAELVCRNALQRKQSAIFMALGGGAAVVLGGVLLISSRKRGHNIPSA